MMMRIRLAHWLRGRSLIAKLDLPLDHGGWRQGLGGLIGRYLIVRGHVTDRRRIVDWSRRLHVIIIWLRRILPRGRESITARRNLLRWRNHLIALRRLLHCIMHWGLIVQMRILLWDLLITPT